MALAQDPALHDQIDAILGEDASSICSDAEFLRRSSIDLTGLPPSVEAAREFLADSSENKRERWIDQLLASPQYVRHLATFLDVTLMERRGHKHVSQDEWMAWLYQSVRENKPWNVLAKEILTADGDQPELRAAVRFSLDRDADPNLLTRDISRIFFGRDIQCAQCHNHPLVSDFLQSDYHGLSALIAPGYAVEVQKGDKKVTVYGERMGKDVQFESVFIKGVPHRSAPRVPGEPALDEPFFLPGEEYVVAVAEGVKAVPKFSRRAYLAEQATSGRNRLFNENIVNRLWAMMFGEGMFHPVDMNQPDNPPLHPELLALLSDRFVAMQFDMRSLLREIALTQAYQRPYDPPADFTSEITTARAVLEQLQSQKETLEQALATAEEAFAQTDSLWHESEKQMLPAITALDAAYTGCADAHKQMKEVETVISNATTQLSSKQTIQPAMKAAMEAATQAVALTPEDQELAAAAKKFLERNEQLTTEIGNLLKVVEENSTKFSTLQETFETSKKNLETSKSGAEELRLAWMEKERQVLAARTQMITEATKLGSVSRQLASAKKLLELDSEAASAAAARQTVSEKSVALATSQQRMTDYSTQMGTMALEVEAVAARQKTAADEMNAANESLTKAREQIDAVKLALQDAENAKANSPEDPALVDAANQLKEKLRVLEAGLAEPVKAVEAATLKLNQAQMQLAAAEKNLKDRQAELGRLEAEVAAIRGELEKVQLQIANSEKALETKTEAVTERLCKARRLAPLKPLTPEQMCWSIFQATGIYQQYWLMESNALDAESPLTEEQKQDPVQVRNRQFQIEQRTYDRLKGHLSSYNAYFGAAAGQPQGDFFATVDQALFVSNQVDLNNWVGPREGNAANRALANAESPLAAEEIYLATLSRMPTPEESELVVSHLSSRSADRAVAVKEMIWSLLTSPEFRFNH
ncbi:DUF1549 domain-containing protein [Planctomicrobium sp. SH661]|uniref:DUF1549 domain-containing protein n=1 Tax=Planctomicrobium sp. SH661 TaxID=3448124 RepID=UPI003F5BEECE